MERLRASVHGTFDIDVCSKQFKCSMVLVFFVFLDGIPSFLFKVLTFLFIFLLISSFFLSFSLSLFFLLIDIIITIFTI